MVAIHVKTLTLLGPRTIISASHLQEEADFYPAPDRPDP